MASPTCAARVVTEDSKRGRDKRFTHHHSQQHIRPQQKTTEKQRRLREKRRTSNANFISTDGTTSGDDPEEMQYSSEQEIQARLEQLLKKPDHLPSDLEADCEDNNSTDLDTISISGTVKHKPDEKERSDTVTEDDSTSTPARLTETDFQLLNAKIRNLEKQLETVLSINVKLKEENEQLKRILPRQNP
uniref:PRKC apoptosis WT1 regulator protein n=1 Tax=Acrobeloides nanus TaxID=290746 RepID=A0A914ECC1_9BILA